MDYYVSRFKELVKDCEVVDYSVYLEKKRGFALLDPLSAYSQLVIYLTDKGNYCLTVSGSGSFGTPERGGFGLRPDGKIASYRGKDYKIARKYKDGRYSTSREFAQAAAR